MKFYAQEEEEEKKVKVELKDGGNSVDILFVCGERKVTIGHFIDGLLNLVRLNGEDESILIEYDVKIDDNEVMVRFFS